MSVLIKGMEMPTSCESCMFSRRSIHNIDWCVLTEKDLPCDCPLVPVPKHGRLIDADELAKVMAEGIAPSAKDGGFQHPFDIFRAISAAPTIIPAQEGE